MASSGQLEHRAQLVEMVPSARRPVCVRTTAGCLAGLQTQETPPISCVFSAGTPRSTDFHSRARLGRSRGALRTVVATIGSHRTGVTVLRPCDAIPLFAHTDMKVHGGSDYMVWQALDSLSSMWCPARPVCARSAAGPNGPHMHGPRRGASPRALNCKNAVKSPEMR